ncbi:sulfite exporter TauE/SafE family protein [Pseudanabaena galeata UHCC 0370]|uniref:Probable membrane transporter protein n=1 Tax=Pseudanabaena galeata UHCC 0370 TaxID=3110310 RepID=A0ABU5TN26_9CYAN|nr:sulfite exporter TauE/SafE family protein [Pseudanabaena galeata]MEA5479711.1 sulfite exporter TauE/SafE family protein [Pseudanabaena galeata UHCC 0370]
MSELMPIVYLSVVSFFAWIISTLAGGGSPFVLIPLVNLLMGAASVPPVITIGMFFGNAHRVFLFWREIDWELTAWYAPGAIAGAVLGAYTFTQIHLDWLQIIIAIFLIVSAFLFELEKNPEKKTVLSLDKNLAVPSITLPEFANQDLIPPLFGESSESNDFSEPEDPTIVKPKFQLEAWHIMPAGFLKAYVSGLVGTTGPVLNPFYLQYGLVKEQMLATKATHMTIIHLVKIITYGAFAAMSKEQVVAGLAIGLAAIPANLIGKYLLSRMSPQQFRQVVLAFMAIGGSWMLWQQRSLFLNIL